MRKPITDPLAFWAGALFRLGLVLAVLAVLPAVIDFVLLNGAAIVLAILALNLLGPLAALCLVAGAGLWIAGKLRK